MSLKKRVTQSWLSHMAREEREEPGTGSELGASALRRNEAARNSGSEAAWRRGPEGWLSEVEDPASSLSLLPWPWSSGREQRGSWEEGERKLLRSVSVERLLRTMPYLPVPPTPPLSLPPPARPNPIASSNASSSASTGGSASALAAAAAKTPLLLSSAVTTCEGSTSDRREFEAFRRDWMSRSRGIWSMLHDSLRKGGGGDQTHEEGSCSFGSRSTSHD